MNVTLAFMSNAQALEKALSDAAELPSPRKNVPGAFVTQLPLEKVLQARSPALKENDLLKRKAELEEKKRKLGLILGRTPEEEAERKAQARKATKDMNKELKESIMKLRQEKRGKGKGGSRGGGQVETESRKCLQG